MNSRARHGVVGFGRRVRRPALIALLLVAVASILGGGAFATTNFYGQFGAPRTVQSELSWAVKPATYLASDCRGCHRDAAAESAGSGHEALLCESCHVPAVDHPGSVDGVVAMLPAPTSAQCVECHAQTQGRPATFPQVPIDRHYVGADCAACHEPHSSTAVQPRPVTHPLDNLPECITCHAPSGLKQFPANHEVAPDSTCLACHRQGAAGIALK